MSSRGRRRAPTGPALLNEVLKLARACLRGRNGDEDSLKRAVSACVSERNAIGATINWRFTAQDARRKLHRLYPMPILIWFSTSSGTNLGQPSSMG